VLLEEKMPGLIGTLILIIVVVYGSFCLYLFLNQGRMIYYVDVPSRRLAASPAAVGLNFETVTLSASDGVKLHGWFIPARDERGTLLFFHGNAGNISHRLDTLKAFHDLGLSTLIIDYRGYGCSQGSITEHGSYLDGKAAWSYLIQVRKIPARQIAVFGRSLGAAIAAHVASSAKPGALILESAFTSVPDLAARLYPVFPVRLLSRYEYNTRKMLLNITCPVMIIHSPQDEIIPFENGLRLYESAREPKRFLKMQGGHNENFLARGQVYRDGVRDFIAASLAVSR
jgi:fermentation-respiration switch protein FrsA (DUF1100 family)